MNKSLKYILLLTAFAVIIIIAVLGYNYLSASYEPYNKTASTQIIKAKDFTVLDQDGNETALSENFGKPIVVNFWATWCGPCKAEMPYFDSAYNEYKDDVVFMMVNITDGVQETVDGVNNFMTQNNYTFPVYYDTEYSAAKAYSITGIPMTIFINEKGEITDKHVGAINESILKNSIKKLTASEK